jgi:hypothetical protein
MPRPAVLALACLAAVACRQDPAHVPKDPPSTPPPPKSAAAPTSPPPLSTALFTAVERGAGA